MPSVQFSSVAQSCPTLCTPMNCSMPGLPVHHQLPEFTQTHAHRVGDAIQPSHPLSSPSPPAPNPSQHQRLFQWVKITSNPQICFEYLFRAWCPAGRGVAASETLSLGLFILPDHVCRLSLGNSLFLHLSSGGITLCSAHRASLPYHLHAGIPFFFLVLSPGLVTHSAYFLSCFSHPQIHFWLFEWPCSSCVIQGLTSSW